MDALKALPALVKLFGPTLAAVIVVSGMAFTQVDHVAEKIGAQIKYNILYDFHRDIEFTLEKQAEKIKNDPGDLKQTDLERFTYHCAGYFGEMYVPTIPSNRKAKTEALCGKVVASYKQKYE
jgi:hypothetical protein